MAFLPVSLVFCIWGHDGSCVLLTFPQLFFWVLFKFLTPQDGPGSSVFPFRSTTLLRWIFTLFPNFCNTNHTQIFLHVSFWCFWRYAFTPRSEIPSQKARVCIYTYWQMCIGIGAFPSKTFRLMIMFISDI